MENGANGPRLVRSHLGERRRVGWTGGIIHVNHSIVWGTEAGSGQWPLIIIQQPKGAGCGGCLSVQEVQGLGENF